VIARRTRTDEFRMLEPVNARAPLLEGGPRLRSASALARELPGPHKKSAFVSRS